MQLIRQGRDLRVDFFRGIALFCIFLDHIPRDALARFTVRNMALNDATEIFILLAGYAASLVYGRKMDRAGVISAASDMLKRSWTLYIAHIFLFVVFVAEVAASAQLFDRPRYLGMIGLQHLIAEPLVAFEQAVKLTYQPSFLNVLPLYVVIMGGVSLVLPLLRRPRLLLALSAALYVAARTTGWNLPSPGGHGWFFNPLTWQLLFVLGALFARYGRPDLPPRITDVLAIILLLIGFSILLTTWLVPDLLHFVPPVVRPLIRDIDKTGLHPYRLMSILALAWLASRYLAPDAALLGTRFARIFVLIGQYGLSTYCASIVLSFAGRVVMDSDDGFGAQLAVNLIGLFSLLGVAAWGAWYKVKDAKAAD